MIIQWTNDLKDCYVPIIESQEIARLCMNTSPLAWQRPKDQTVKLTGNQNQVVLVSMTLVLRSESS